MTDADREDRLQDRYAGDVGDFVKFALLRRLAEGRRVGVLWWLYPDEQHNADGKHVSYLTKPLLWRSRDPALFDALDELVTSGRRHVAALEAAQLLPGATYHRTPVPTIGTSAMRGVARGAWFDEARKAVTDCDLVFIDPDNGLETANFAPGGSRAGKSVSLAELQALRKPGRTLVVYHHQTRMAGGHAFELEHWGRRLGELGFEVDALRASAFSARAFFLLDATTIIRDRAEALAREWGDQLTWHPALSHRS